jgi:hypothetical protein
MMMCYEKKEEGVSFFNFFINLKTETININFLRIMVEQKKKKRGQRVLMIAFPIAMFAIDRHIKFLAYLLLTGKLHINI